MRRRYGFLQFEGPEDPRLTSVHIVSGLGAGAGPGPGPGPSTAFIIWVMKGGNDGTGDGTDEAPYLTIGKAMAVAKTLAVSTTQLCEILVGPGVYAENVAMAPFTVLNSLDETTDAVTVNGTLQLDTAAWIAAGANPIAGIDGINPNGLVTIDYTGVNSGSFEIGGSFMNAGITGIGDTATICTIAIAANCFSAGPTTFSGLNVNSIGLRMFDTVTMSSTNSQPMAWSGFQDAIGGLGNSPTVTFDGSAGQSVTVECQGVAMGLAASLTLKGNGGPNVSYRATNEGYPNVVILLNGATLANPLSPLIASNSKDRTGANVLAGKVATADGAGNVDWTSPSAGAGTRAYYGDKSDGNVNVIGTLTLTRDMFFDHLTVGPGTQVDTASFRIYADRITNNGVIFNDGANAAGQTHGAGVLSGTVFGGTDGADGVVATIASGAINGNPGVNQTIGGANNSGRGGTGGNAGVGTGGLGGTLHTLVGTFGDTRAAPQSVIGAFLGVSPVGGVISSPISVDGGTGGGSGAAAPNNPNSTSGGGGGGAGVIVISCRVLDGNGQIEAVGGAGGAATTGIAGGGGGGGGGQIILTCGDQTGYIGSFAVDGGAGGAGLGGAPNGANGAIGTIIQVPG